MAKQRKGRGFRGVRENLMEAQDMTPRNTDTSYIHSRGFDKTQLHDNDDELDFEAPEVRVRQVGRKFWTASDANRIKTMWSAEYGWCRWDSEAKDYVPDPQLN